MLFLVKILLRKNTYTIEREKVKEGVIVCFNKACLIIDSAISLLKNHESPDVIIGLTTIALEEFGKGLLLKDFLSVDREKYKIPQDLFKTASSHFKKIGRGLQEIPKESKYIYPPLLVKLFNHPEVKMEINGNETKITIPKKLINQFKNFDFKEVTFSSKYAPRIINQDNSVANFPSRMLCFYVDWNKTDENWETGVETSNERLEKLVKSVKEKILEFHECEH